jgi:hypothetical protein
MDSQENFKPYATRFEFCSICQCLYTLQGRKQHLRTRKHCKKVGELNLEDSLIPVEHYTLTLEGEVLINED